MVAGATAAADARNTGLGGAGAWGIFRETADPKARSGASIKGNKRRISALGTNDSVSVDEEMASTIDGPLRIDAPASGRKLSFGLLIVVFFAAAVFLACIISPPSLMDDVDAVQAQIARNMLSSGDWVTARLDGVPYLEKAPLIYWLIAGAYEIFGVSDWAARLPVALAAIGLALFTALFGRWAFGERAGCLAGLAIGTCAGLFLFTRIQIPDVMLTATITLAMFAFLRALDPEEERPRRWALLLAASIGVGLLLKSLIAAVFPIGAGLAYLLITGRLFDRESWRRLHPISGTLVI